MLSVLIDAMTFDGAKFRALHGLGRNDFYVSQEGPDFRLFYPDALGAAPIIPVLPDRLTLESDAAPGMDGTPRVASNGVAFHTITIKKKSPAGADVPNGAEALMFCSGGLASVSDMAPVLVNGVAQVTVGPELKSGNIVVCVKDQAGVLLMAELEIGFG